MKEILRNRVENLEERFAFPEFSKERVPWTLYVTVTYHRSESTPLLASWLPSISQLCDLQQIWKNYQCDDPSHLFDSNHTWGVIGV